MDDLEFRRTIYADPHSQDERLKHTAGKEPAKAQAWQEAKQLDERIKRAAHVAVPEGMAQRLLLRQSMQEFRQQRQRRHWTLGLAASFVLMVGLSFVLWQQGPVEVDLTENALAHIYHEEKALIVDEDISLTQVNAKLASFGGEFTADIGKVYYANFCHFKHVKSLHLVVGSPQGKVTVFIVPHHQGQKTDDAFSDKRYQGKTLDMQQASLILVGDKQQQLVPLEEKLKTRLRFSA
ncbi:DUF3379 family protein [Bowmanella denitrificans]|uniref:DUF3379 family protein n=1 Tax=Bowmanella denitrificans TaxID=366582 RepID=UPI000C99E258|nr:DUF3379 family protein [Bowmanella denitrificans]